MLYGCYGQSSVVVQPSSISDNAFLSNAALLFSPPTPTYLTSFSFSSKNTGSIDAYSASINVVSF